MTHLLVQVSNILSFDPIYLLFDSIDSSDLFNFYLFILCLFQRRHLTPWCLTNRTTCRRSCSSCFKAIRCNKSDLSDSFDFSLNSKVKCELFQFNLVQLSTNYCFLVHEISQKIKMKIKVFLAKIDKRNVLLCF